MRHPEHVVFLHGLGAGPSSWRAQVDALPGGFVARAPDLLPAAGGRFTLDAAVRAVVDGLDAEGVERAHLVGLSLGAVVALGVAIRHPERVGRLVLSGGQVRPPRALMAAQAVVLRALPERVVRDTGSKAALLSVLREMSRIDLRADLARVSAPTLVLCGTRDRPNRPAARALATGIPQARLVFVEGGGHELNIQRPDEFAAALNAFLLESR